MPAAGWYPDPEGAAGRFRYWDGRTWTATTTTDPRMPPSGFGPPSTTPGGTPPPPRRRRTGWVIAAVALVLVIAVVAGFAVFGNRDDPDADSLPTSTVSSYDDGKTGTPTPSSSASGSPSAQPSARAVACDQASPDSGTSPPRDGRVHGGPLSFTELPKPWQAPTATSRVPYSRDSQVQVLRLDEELPWQASAQVGVATFDPFPGGSTATQQMLECVLTSDFYTSVEVHLAKNAAAASTISGRPATVRDALLTFSHPQLKTKGSLLRFVVVESDPVTYFFSAVPMERSDLIGQLDAATASLQLS